MKELHNKSKWWLQMPIQVNLETNKQYNNKNS